MGSSPADAGVKDREALILESIRHSYDFRAPPDLTLHGRSCNWTYRITADGETMWLRWNVARMIPEWVSEVRLLQTLFPAVRGIPTPIARKDGGFAGLIGDGAGILWQNSPGIVIDPPTTVSARILGRWLAALHQQRVAVERDHPGLTACSPVQEACGRYQPGTAPILDRAIARLIARSEQRGRCWPFFGVIHGDFHAANALITPAGTSCPIDWEWSGAGWRSIDVAVIQHTWERKIPDNKLRGEVWGIFTSAYCTEWEHGEVVLEDLALGRAWRAVWQTCYALSTPDRRPPGYQEKLLLELGTFLQERLDIS